MSISPAPIKEKLETSPGILSRVWTRFFGDVFSSITNIQISVDEAVEGATMQYSANESGRDLSKEMSALELMSAMQTTENPTFEGRITALENELGEAMVQLETVITKLSESQRIMEDMFLQMMITNKLLHFTADAQSQFLGVPMKFDKLDNLEELI